MKIKMSIAMSKEEVERLILDSLKGMEPAGAGGRFVLGPYANVYDVKVVWEEQEEVQNELSAAAQVGVYDPVAKYFEDARAEAENAEPPGIGGMLRQLAKEDATAKAAEAETSYVSPVHVGEVS